MDFIGQHKIKNFTPPKGQVAGSNPARDANEINGLHKIYPTNQNYQGAYRVQIE